MHDRAYTMYNSQNLRFALPVIIISTVTGTANFAQGLDFLRSQVATGRIFAHDGWTAFHEDSEYEVEKCKCSEPGAKK